MHREFGLKFWAFVCGGGALPGPLEQFWNALGFVLVQGYGMTETTAIITLNHPFHVAEGTIGKPLPGREVKLGPDGEVLVRGAIDLRVPPGRTELCSPRDEEWLATGDIAERQESGELRFLGRKSEVIVTAAGVNLHPEDIEAAIEEQPDVAACAVVAMETATGPEPCAVLACRGSGELRPGRHRARQCQAAGVPARSAAGCCGRSRICPRTSTGKVKRKPVAAWLARDSGRGRQQRSHQRATARHCNATATMRSGPRRTGCSRSSRRSPGKRQSGVGDELRLTEDLHLDSLGRVQLGRRHRGAAGHCREQRPA